jgi:hypothetical protein
MSLIDDGGKRVIEPGEFVVNTSTLTGRFTISGRNLELKP